MSGKWMIALLAGLLALALALPASAAKKPGAAPEKEEQMFDFEGDTIDADVLKPDVSSVGVVTREDQVSLIKLRNDFVDEIVRSAEDI